jgi:Na+/H+-dicarboxylate symporter
MKLRGYIGYFVGSFIWIDSDFYPADQAGSFFNGYYIVLQIFLFSIMVGVYLIYSRQNFRINKKRP